MSTAQSMAATNQNSVTGTSETSGLDSEIQLVSSLAKLQELERKVSTGALATLPQNQVNKISRSMNCVGSCLKAY
jgi:hypothetical protein